MAVARRFSLAGFFALAFFGYAVSSSAAVVIQGEPIFCQPNEGVGFPIINNGTGLFRISQNCYGNASGNHGIATINTSQGGVLSYSSSVLSQTLYTYKPPSLNFTGQDTFSLAVTTVRNPLGGPGNANGGAATLTITLNVLPATTTLTVAFETATNVPIPTGSITGCAASNGGAGVSPGSTYGCVTALVTGSVTPSHGTFVNNGSTIRYTPATGYSGSDTFTYRAQAVSADGNAALSTDEITMNVTVSPAPISTPAPPSFILLVLGIALAAALAALVKRRGPREALG